jgi:hypothetical protein
MYSSLTLACGGEGAGGPKSYESTETLVLYCIFNTHFTIRTIFKVWETKEDQARKTKSRLERRLARKKDGMDIEGNNAG